ncbi:MAG TPA: hypothetical protein VFK57_05935 [Vicinamibacterales bacterium]|nr:hypothetical protein [Vicinamibacterales bacterium]
MASRGLESEIDRLYQLPPSEFTAARNALAKRAGGSDAARIRALARPPITAWAVNQLYWQHGDVWNDLIAAAENARKAHRAVLAGRSGDVRAAGKVHEEAVERALKTTLTLLAAADHPATDATRHAVATTLRALPGDEPPGRLTHALQPAGFELLSGLPIAPGPPRPQRPAPEKPAAREAGAAPAPKVDAKALTKAKHDAASAARALREAETAARREEFETARTEREEKRAADVVERAREALARAEQELDSAETAARQAVQARKAAAKRAAEAQDALAEARRRAGTAAAELAAMESGRKPR